MKPLEGIGCPSVPLRRGPDGLEFWLQGTILKVAPVSTKYLSLVSLSVRKQTSNVSRMSQKTCLGRLARALA